MGNNASNQSRPSPASPPNTAGPSVSSASSSRRESRIPHHHLHRGSAAPPEPSLAQARGSTVPHRIRDTKGRPVSHLESHTSSPHSSSPISRGSPGSPSPKTIEKASRNTTRDEPSKPVDVPAPTSNIESTSLRSHSIPDVEPSAPPQDMSYHLTRPPRLPLPIEQEVHTPGSPIIAPADVDAPVLDADALEEGLRRRSSGLSQSTAEEEEDEELPVDRTKATVPTTFDWSGGGDRVYVTGTIFQWSRKHRLHPAEGRPGVLTATIPVLPGTHHVRFIVDGALSISGDLPTTVDFGNNLVNYIEVSPDDLPAKEAAAAAAAAAESDTTASETQKTPESSQQSVETPAGDDTRRSSKPQAKVKTMPPKTQYTSKIPQYLLDLDKPEDSSAYQYAAAAIEKLPPPPSLPGFLAKPILNAATPIRDDNSVLNMPNHTVLNHLATSSIKNNVLAVSGTTRYKKKYVTIIMYKPTSDDTS